MDESAAFIAALEDLERALEANTERARRMQARIVELRTAHSAGFPLRQFVPREEQPLIVRLLSESARELDEYGSVVRRVEARALRGGTDDGRDRRSLRGLAPARVGAAAQPGPALVKTLCGAVGSVPRVLASIRRRPLGTGAPGSDISPR
ncbi:MAG TPA: hypothetical protein VLP43_03590 [Solirubrobacteraceae bacterium]|nr:hypothetical protein [Solirubrobacteraceae bacterium]